MVSHDQSQAKPSLLRRVFSRANVVALGVSVVAFVIALTIDDTNGWVFWSAVVAGAIGGVVWYIMASRSNEGSAVGVLRSTPLLGSIPEDDEGPAPAMSGGDTADRYTGLLREVEGHTSGRVLLVSSPGPGQGASSVALNLSIAAAKAGRRVMLVDADPSPHGLSQFLSSGSSPGLSDVAAGTATLTEASRMWTLDDGSKFPMLPSGEDIADSGALKGLLVADALDVVSEHADLILIDVPPVLWSDVAPELGAHADGTILVVSDSASPEVVTSALEELEAAGAPVVGYVRNRSNSRTAYAPHRGRSALVRAVGLALALLVGYSIYTGAQLLYSWLNVETEAYEPEAVAQLTVEQPVEAAPEEDVVELVPEDQEALPAPPPVQTPTEAYETMLLIGSDQIAGASDVVIYLVRPTNGADPFMVSFPRDLYVENPCTGGNTRINTLIKGCRSEDINGPTLLSAKVSELTGIEVDHFAWFEFEGFVDVVDAVGGIELCFENPVRDFKAKLDMPAGCTQATGEQTLAWVRSRKTQQNINGSWRSVPGSGDLTRNQHQQDVILELFTKLKTFDSPTQLTTTVASVAGAFVLDDEVGLAEAVELAWGLRAIELEDIRRIELPVRLTRSTKGQSILVTTASFDEVLLEEFGRDLPTEDRENAAAPG